ncbi:MAG: hypothetical protein ACOYL6_17955 [Bacteriovoracaceae bacterium]
MKKALWMISFITAVGLNTAYAQLKTMPNTNNNELKHFYPVACSENRPYDDDSFAFFYEANGIIKASVIWVNKGDNQQKILQDYVKHGVPLLPTFTEDSYGQLTAAWPSFDIFIGGEIHRYSATQFVEIIQKPENNNKIQLRYASWWNSNPGNKLDLDCVGI